MRPGRYMGEPGLSPIGAACHGVGLPKTESPGRIRKKQEPRQGWHNAGI